MVGETRPEFPADWQIKADWDPMANLINLKGKEYLNVQNRMLWFLRDQRRFIANNLAQVPYVVRTELVEMDREAGFAHFKTYVRDVLGNEATMYGSESAKDFGDYPEKASTKSLGRALLALGYGTAFAPEMDEGEQVVDAPVEVKAKRTTSPAPVVATRTAAPAATTAPVRAPRQPAPAVEPDNKKLAITQETALKVGRAMTAYPDIVTWMIEAHPGVFPGVAAIQFNQVATEEQGLMLLAHYDRWFEEYAQTHELPADAESAEEEEKEEAIASVSAPVVTATLLRPGDANSPTVDEYEEYRRRFNEVQAAAREQDGGVDGAWLAQAKLGLRTLMQNIAPFSAAEQNGPKYAWTQGQMQVLNGVLGKYNVALTAQQNYDKLLETVRKSLKSRKLPLLKEPVTVAQMEQLAKQLAAATPATTAA